MLELTQDFRIYAEARCDGPLLVEGPFRRIGETEGQQERQGALSGVEGSIKSGLINNERAAAGAEQSRLFICL